jgi:hypothetical protein
MRRFLFCGDEQLIRGHLFDAEGAAARRRPCRARSASARAALDARRRELSGTSAVSAVGTRQTMQHAGEHMDRVVSFSFFSITAARIGRSRARSSTTRAARASASTAFNGLP